MILLKKRQTKIILAMAAALFCILAQGVYALAALERELVPMGNAVGIQMYTDGVLVVGLAATEKGEAASPAAVAGILPGDLITAVGTKRIRNAEDFRALVSELRDEEITITVSRGKETLKLKLRPNYNDAVPEMGLWLRDSISGIGTLTFYDPETKLYGALGHGVNDISAGVIMPMGRGEIYRASILEVRKGSPGQPGELYGVFDTNGVYGNINLNTDSGIFGKLETNLPSKDEAIPVAKNDDIVLGEAWIRSNVNGRAVEEFEVEITRVYRGETEGRTLMLSIKDQRLLDKTGGIVQGMSGSPIIQNGKLIGAVTHVLVHDPTKGFGVSIENMLRESESADVLPENAA